jgi:hypothetical protein
VIVDIKVNVCPEMVDVFVLEETCLVKFGLDKQLLRCLVVGEFGLVNLTSEEFLYRRLGRSTGS